MLPDVLRLPVTMLAQPDNVSCGPTCLHALYRYWGAREPLQKIMARTRKLEHGGTFAVFLACDALRRGFEATIYTYNLTVFDPMWFRAGVDIADRLRRQREAKKKEANLQHATDGYLEFLDLGGRLRLTDLSRGLIRGILRRRVPILTGLSSTWLYQSAREWGPQDKPDDVRGGPAGHFVILSGYDRRERKVLVVDPYAPHPHGPRRRYWINIDRVLGAVLLGIVTHDANLVVVRPRRNAARHQHA